MSFQEVAEYTMGRKEQQPTIESIQNLYENTNEEKIPLKNVGPIRARGENRVMR